jgi:hypothetical protein
MSTTSLPLFDTRLASHAHVRLSKNETWARILEYAELRGRLGFTADELAAAWGCSHNHVAPRICELSESGDLVLTGERRRTRSGFFAGVYVAKQFPQQRRADPAAPAEDYRLFPDDAPPRHLDLG